MASLKAFNSFKIGANSLFFFEILDDNSFFDINSSVLSFKFFDSSSNLSSVGLNLKQNLKNFFEKKGSLQGDL